MRIKKFNEEVLFANERIVKIGRKNIEFLKKKCRRNKRKRIRLCAHKNIKDNLHEMFIVHTNGAYIRPHRHLKKEESIHIIEGLVDVVVFGAAGAIAEVIRMGNYLSGKPFYHRFSKGYHMLLIRSKLLVYHETTNGPFKRSDTIFPPWAPGEIDNVAKKEFMKLIAEKIKVFLKKASK